MSEIEKGRKDMMGAKEDFSKIFDFHDPTLNEKYSKSLDVRARWNL